MTDGETRRQVIIVGGGIGGVICLRYARAAGVAALLLESREGVGGLWRDLPAWQDIQFRKEDWALGDLPLDGERQPSILRNIVAWVDRFGLSPDIRLNSPVVGARWEHDHWRVTTSSGELEADWLIAATGGHNRPVVPEVERIDSAVTEYHSSSLQNPVLLRGKRVTVVGGGASAYDLLDLCFAHGAQSVAWVYRSTRWMRPTRKSKYLGTDMRLLAKYQMIGMPTSLVNRLTRRDLHRRYAKAGLDAIKPSREFDMRRDQLIPGRPLMIQHFGSIDRHRGEVESIRGNTVRLTDGESLETDLLLWGTGYSTDLDYLGIEAISRARSLNDISRRCHSVFRSTDAPNLFLLAPGVLDSNSSTPWAYAHVARSIMSHIAGHQVFDGPSRRSLTNHFDLAKMLARCDRTNYPFGLWYLRYLGLALFHAKEEPLPLP